MTKVLAILFSFFANVLMIEAQLQQSLYYYADKCDSLKIGAAVGSQFYLSNVYDKGDSYDQIVKDNFNILVAENEMKYDATEPQKGVFNFTKPDMLVTYAQKYGKQVRGHTLCWHSQLPSWLTKGLTNEVANGTYSRASLMEILKNHITTIVSRYKGKIQQWDVINEPFKDGSGTLRSSIWQQVIGNDYIDSAFVWAHRADPNAKLYLNEYGAESYGSTKSNAMYNYTKSMKERGIPITGVGLQCHFTVNSINFTKLEQNIKRYADIGLEAIMTELDVRITKTDYNADINKWLSYQAEDYRKLVKICLDNSNAKTILTWGFTDKYSWIPNFTNNLSGYALIFDDSYNAKPAYNLMLTELVDKCNLSSLDKSIDDCDIKLWISDNMANLETDKRIYRCQLFDMQGRSLYLMENMEFSAKIPLNYLRRGVYIFKIRFEDGKVSSLKFAL